MLLSLLAHRGGHPLHVHYLHGLGLPDDARTLLRRMVESEAGTISFIRVPDELVAGLPTAGYTGKATWYRILLADLLVGVDRVLSLDADLIAVDSLAPLWRTDLDGHYLAAVTNVFQWDHLEHAAKLGLPRNSYFNAGVALLNLDLIRRDDRARALKEYALGHSPPWRDQDTLNVVLGERRLPLHPRWNCMNSILEFPSAIDVFGAEAVRAARRNPAIRHFEGPDVNKPWHYMCERGMRELYLDYRARTPWPDMRLEGRTPLNVLRRLGARLPDIRKGGRLEVNA